MNHTATDDGVFRRAWLIPTAATPTLPIWVKLTWRIGIRGRSHQEKALSGTCSLDMCPSWRDWPVSRRTGDMIPSCLPGVCRLFGVARGRSSEGVEASPSPNPNEAPGVNLTKSLSLPETGGRDGVVIAAACI
ncbi:hypothetical protein CROQUDRAFT_657788 [Cronartium quercuum f. sp. fusiforme G11]|uniref:Uncharacterized protein n=1 Tax=Cronartium quercuum f. sp. fusiforme G11 TaxID=708437 RepID=A0A9P6TBD6_9BASI|nr:hypothetical protein CROQUDRAFT_657788 [Cronartium quercuum f. sp. fusiforme G11]